MKIKVIEIEASPEDLRSSHALSTAFSEWFRRAIIPQEDSEEPEEKS